MEDSKTVYWSLMRFCCVREREKSDRKYQIRTRNITLYIYHYITLQNPQSVELIQCSSWSGAQRWAGKQGLSFFLKLSALFSILYTTISITYCLYKRVQNWNTCQQRKCAPVIICIFEWLLSLIFIMARMFGTAKNTWPCCAMRWSRPLHIYPEHTCAHFQFEWKMGESCLKKNNK